MDVLKVNRTVSIPMGEIDIRTGPSSGPGGQHANRSSTRVDVSFDVAASANLSEAQKRRAIERAGRVVTAASQDERSQARNRDLALERLADKLRAALTVPRTRRPTRPTTASKERRIAGKKRRGEIKAARRKPWRDE